MQKTFFITAAIIAVVIGLLVAVNVGWKGGGMQYSSAALLSDHMMFDFATTPMQQGVVMHDFDVENNGDEPLVIQKVYTSCMCTQAKIIDAQGKEYGAFGMPGHGAVSAANVTMKPGEHMTVRAIFDPAAHGPSGVGLAQRSIYLETNSATNPKLEFKFQALVTNQ